MEVKFYQHDDKSLSVNSGCLKGDAPRFAELRIGRHEARIEMYVDEKDVLEFGLDLIAAGHEFIQLGRGLEEVQPEDES